MANMPPFNLPQALQQAFQAFGAGRIDVATNMAESIIKRFPREPNAQYLLGNISHSNKDFDKAAKYYKKAFKFDRNNVGAIAGLGTVALDTFQYRDAIQHFQKAIKLAKKPDAALLNNLGLAYKGNEEVIKARDTFEKAIQVDPKSAIAHLNLGQLASVVGFNEKAQKHYSISLQIDPNNPEALSNLGGIERLLGNLSKAVQLFEKALDLDPNFLTARNSLAYAFVDMGKFEEAEKLYKKSLSIDSTQKKALVELGELLYAQNRKDEALLLCEEATNDITKSTNLNQYEAYTLHRLGIAFDRLKKHKDSFRCYKAAHEQWNSILHAGGNGYNRKNIEKSLQDTIAIFSEISPKNNARGHPSKRPIFITGMPRSGTSLLEQILASHPDVYGAGESHLIPFIKSKITKGPKDWMHSVPNLSNDELLAFGQYYIDEIEKESNNEAYFTDKLPHNFQNIGLIRLIFPNALIIHNKRNPIDTSLSVFKQKFGSEMQFDHTLEDIAHFYTHYYDKLTKFWQEWDETIVAVQYENVISDQEKETRRLLDLIGIPWNDNCLQFHKTDREVKTASRLQVRQPLYNSSVDKWRIYEEELQPLIKGLGNLVSV